MVVGDLASWAFSCLLLSMRVAPAFALAPPFTLTRVPGIMRVILALALAGCMISMRPEALITDISAAFLLSAAVRELFLGGVFALALQLVYGALHLAGRTVDIQAGFGLAAVVDPTTRASMPLVGALFGYAFAAVFFAMDGPGELLRIMSASLDAIPIGMAQAPVSLARLTGFISTVFLTAFGVAGGAVLTLFIADMGVALLARTAPQMNALLFGFQAKTLLLLIVLPTSFGVSGALLARLARITLEALPGLL